MPLPRVRFTLRRMMLGIVMIAVVFSGFVWLIKNVPTSYEELPTRSGGSEYRAHYADGTVSEKDPQSGRWVRRLKTSRE